MKKINNKQIKNIKAVFFDFGGTLMDSESDIIAHINIMKDIAQKYNLSASPEEMADKYNSFIFTKKMTLLDLDSNKKSFSPLRESTHRAVRKIFSFYHIEPSDENMNWFSKVYLKNHRKYLKLFPETLDVIQKIRNIDSIHIGIISDIDTDFQKSQFDAFGISPLFDSITTSEEVQSYKPRKNIFNVAFEKADCRGTESIMVGDSYEKDIVGGKNMGMTTIWLNRYYGKNAEGEKADFIINQLKDISPFINELTQ
ncbi:MAG: HAD family hydrolase [Candidatus Caldatribacteriota bacterium]|nr:HAD family hydrolase [Candidatus Caldatribacteriota bacterium]